MKTDKVFKAFLAAGALAGIGFGTYKLVEFVRKDKEDKHSSDNNRKVDWKEEYEKLLESTHYNPLTYISDNNVEEDIREFVDTLYENTNDVCINGNTEAEKLLFTAYIALLLSIFPPEERSLETLIELIKASEWREDNEEFKNAVDLLFQFLEIWLNGDKITEDMEGYEDFIYFNDSHPEERQLRIGKYAIEKYKSYKLAAGKAIAPILASCSLRLASLVIKENKKILRCG